jgi:hypothetical protein
MQTFSAPFACGCIRSSGELRTARHLGIPSVERRFPSGAFSITHLDEFDPLSFHWTAGYSVDPVGYPGSDDRAARDEAERLLEAVLLLAGKTCPNDLIQFALSLDCRQIGEIYGDVFRKTVEKLRERGAVL